jgi:hypothetical protein
MHNFFYGGTVQELQHGFLTYKNNILLRRLQISIDA